MKQPLHYKGPHEVSQKSLCSAKFERINKDPHYNEWANHFHPLVFTTTSIAPSLRHPTTILRDPAQFAQTPTFLRRQRSSLACQGAIFSVSLPTSQHPKPLPPVPLGSPSVCTCDPPEGSYQRWSSALRRSTCSSPARPRRSIARQAEGDQWAFTSPSALSGLAGFDFSLLQMTRPRVNISNCWKEQDQVLIKLLNNTSHL